MSRNAFARIASARRDGGAAQAASPADFNVDALRGAIGAAESLPLASAEPAPSGVVEWPRGFHMEENGLFYDEPGRQGAEPLPVRLSDRFTVQGEARDPDGDGWALIIAFHDRDGREKREVIPKAKLASGGADVRAELMAKGLWIVTGRGQAERFVAALAGVRAPERIWLHPRTGWAGDKRFVLPDRVIGPAGEAGLFTGDARGFRYGSSGDLAGWIDTVARPLASQRLGVFALCLAFAGPCLVLLGEDGGGFHIRGGSSSGKTTLARTAGSVWGGGGPLGYAQTWRSTANALEAVAAGHSDTLLILDELGLLSPDEAGAAAYALMSGQAKARARTDGAMRARLEWRLMLLSTGEVSLADHVRAARNGGKPMAGQELRMLDIDADLAAGVWENLPENVAASHFSDDRKKAADTHYGHAGPEFVRWLIETPRARDVLREVVTRFERSALRPDDTGQVRRAARRFAIVAAAGEAAILAGVLPFAEGACVSAALFVFERWASGFGRNRTHEDREALVICKRAIEANESRFATIREEDDQEAGDRAGEARSLHTLGFRWRDGDGTLIYLFHDAGWSEIFAGMDRRRAARTLCDAGFLKTDQGRLQKKVRVRGVLRSFYAVKASILDGDFDA